jgi:hypothetical protein
MLFVEKWVTFYGLEMCKYYISCEILSIPDDSRETISGIVWYFYVHGRRK